MSERRNGPGPCEFSEAGDTQSSNNEEVFLNLKEGSNVVRIISTKPYRFFVHHLPNNVDGKLTKVKCSLTPTCPACTKVRGADKANQNWWKAKTRYYLQVIDRKTDTCRILETPSQVMEKIKFLNSQPYWGAPQGYDVDIFRKPLGSNPLYDMVALEKRPLTQQETTRATEFLSKATQDNRLLIEVLAATPTDADVDNMMNTTKEDRKNARKAAAQQNPQTAAGFDRAAQQEQSQVNNNFAPPPNQSPQPYNAQPPQFAPPPQQTYAQPQWAPPVQQPQYAPAPVAAPQYAPQPSPQQQVPWTTTPVQHTVPSTVSTTAVPSFANPGATVQAPQQNTNIKDPTGVNQNFLKHI